MILPILIGWLLGVPLAIWWPRQVDDDSARSRAYRSLRRASACLLPGYVLWAVLMLALNTEDSLFTVLLVLFVLLGALALTPLALSILALDFRSRWLGLGGGVLAALFPAGITCYAALILLSIRAGGFPLWYVLPAGGAALFCGGATAFVLEAYAVMRLPQCF